MLPQLVATSTKFVVVLLIFYALPLTNVDAGVIKERETAVTTAPTVGFVAADDLDIIDNVHSDGESGTTKIESEIATTIPSTKLRPQLNGSENIILQILKERSRDALLRLQKASNASNPATLLDHDDFDASLLSVDEKIANRSSSPITSTTKQTLSNTRKITIDTGEILSVDNGTTSDSAKLSPSTESGKLSSTETSLKLHLQPVAVSVLNNAKVIADASESLESNGTLTLPDLIMSTATPSQRVVSEDDHQRLSLETTPPTTAKSDVHSDTVKVNEESNEIRLRTSTHNGGSEKRAKFINDNSTNAQQLNLPDIAEVWSLAGMKTIPKTNLTTERPINNSVEIGGNSEKNLLDWTQIMMNLDLDQKQRTNLVARNISKTTAGDDLMNNEDHTESLLRTPVSADVTRNENGIRDANKQLNNSNTSSTHLPQTVNEISIDITTSAPSGISNTYPNTIAASYNTDSTADSHDITPNPESATTPNIAHLSSTLEATKMSDTTTMGTLTDNSDNELKIITTTIATRIGAEHGVKLETALSSNTNISERESDDDDWKPIIEATTSRALSKLPSTPLPMATNEPITLQTLPEMIHSRTSSSNNNSSNNKMNDSLVPATPNAYSVSIVAAREHNASFNEVEVTLNANKGSSKTKTKSASTNTNTTSAIINNNNGTSEVDANADGNASDYDADDEGDDFVGNDNKDDDDGTHRLSSSSSEATISTLESVQVNGGAAVKRTLKNSTRATSDISLHAIDVTLATTIPVSAVESTITPLPSAAPTTPASVVPSATATITRPLPTALVNNPKSIVATETTQIANNEIVIDTSNDSEIKPQISAIGSSANSTHSRGDENGIETGESTTAPSTSFANELLIPTTTTATITTPNKPQNPATGSASVLNEVNETSTTAIPTVKTTTTKPSVVVATTAVAVNTNSSTVRETETSIETNVIDLLEPTTTAAATAPAITPVNEDKFDDSVKKEEESKTINTLSESDGDTMSPITVSSITAVSTTSTSIFTTTTPPPLISLLDDSTTTSTTSTTIPPSHSVSTKIEETYSVFSTTPAPTTTEISNMTITTIVSLPPQAFPAATVPPFNETLPSSSIPIPTQILPTNANLPASDGAMHPDVAGIGNIHPNSTDASETDVNVIIAIVVSVVGVIALVLLVAFLYLMRKRQKQMSYGQRCRPVSLDAYSLDNVSVLGSVRRKGAQRASKRSYGNVAFDDPSLRHNVQSATELGKFVERRSSMFEEFRDVPQIIARADEVPPGCEDKNRYANVIPLPETRVILQQQNNDEKTEYINANYVRGPKDPPNYYIACQAPLEITIADFWRMIWEQQSRVIIQATDLIENGIEKCAEYLPPSVTLDNHTTFGDFQVTLKNREVKDKYAISTLMLKNTLEDASRELTHYWYKWPETGVPNEEAPIIAMLLEARASLKSYAIEQANELKEKPSIIPLKVDSGQSINDSKSSSLSDSDEKKETSISNVGGSNGEINGNVSTDKLKAAARNQGPLTIHCSPGTGRTGTIISCDIAIRSLETPKRNVDIPQIVYYVRRGRASAVQTKEQYEFIYKVANMYATKITNLSNDN